MGEIRRRKNNVHRQPASRLVELESVSSVLQKDLDSQARITKKAAKEQHAAIKIASSRAQFGAATKKSLHYDWRGSQFRSRCKARNQIKKPNSPWETDVC